MIFGVLPSIASGQHCNGTLAPCAYRFVTAAGGSGNTSQSTNASGSWSNSVVWREPPISAGGPDGGGRSWQDSLISESCLWTRFQTIGDASAGGSYGTGQAAAGFESVFEVAPETAFILNGSWSTEAWYVEQFGDTAGKLELVRLSPNPQVIARTAYDPNVAPAQGQLSAGTISLSGILPPGVYKVHASSTVSLGNLVGMGWGFSAELSMQIFPASSCRSDANRDGNVDGDDIIVFFTWWNNSDHHADYTVDGGVDGEDVIAFFAAWDSGC